MFKKIDRRISLFVLMIALFVLGAGAPGATGVQSDRIMSEQKIEIRSKNIQTSQQTSMVLLVAIMIGLAATLLRARLNHRTLKIPRLHLEWLIFLAVVPQILIFQIPGIARLIPQTMVPWIQLLSMIGLIIFTGINLTIPGFWALGIGLLGNFLVIASNGGWMPISPETVSRLTAGDPDYVVMVDARLGYSKDWVMDLTITRLPWLSDIFTLPAWCPYKVAFSLGDVFIFIGAVLVLWSLSNEVKEEK